MDVKVELVTTEGGVQEAKTNFNDIKRVVEAEVKKHSVDVTEDNLKEAKDVMAKMNKVKKEVGDKYKHHIDTLSLPVNQLKDEKKQLENIIAQGRKDIADAVAVFEQKKLDIAKEVILQYVSDICLEKGIDSKAIVTQDLVKLTAVTAKGALTKSTKEVIDGRIQTVENEVLRAKLEAEEKRKRDEEIAAKARKEAEEAARKREEEIKRQAEVDKAKAVEDAKKEVADGKLPGNVVAVEKVEPVKEANGQITHTVLATFKITVKEGVTKERIANAVEQRLLDAGVTTLQKIEVM